MFLAIACASSLGAGTDKNDVPRPMVEPAVWQGPAFTAQLVPATPHELAAPNATIPGTGTPTNSVPNSRAPLSTPPQAPANGTMPSSAGSHFVPSTPSKMPSPLLDGNTPAEELMPPVVAEGSCQQGAHESVQPYGGGHPSDWSWGCGGSPYRTGPGLCDNWKVGCRWRVTADGIVMTREKANLEGLADEMEDNHQGAEDLEDPVFVQFDHGPGGRITFTSQVGRCTGWDVMCAYEGIENWNSSITFEKEDFEPVFYTPVITTTVTTDTDTNNDTDTTTETNTSTNNNTTTTTSTTTVMTDNMMGTTTNDTSTNTQTDTQNQTTTQTETNTDTDNNTETSTTTEQSYAPGPTPLQPGDPFPEGSEQRILHYRSSLNSGELNFVRSCDPVWRPYCGFRYIRFDDQINDFTNQEAQPPVAFAGPDPGTGPGQFLAVATTDRLNLFDIENNLMGFQVGMLHDSWCVNNRLALDGFVNAGVYYNKIKYSNVMGIFTTQQTADDTSTTAFNEARTDVSSTINNDVRTLSEISYTAEASLSAVCRLNRCWALRAGYQVLWISNVHLAEDAYLHDGETEGRDLLFHGWHAGIECRR